MVTTGRNDDWVEQQSLLGETEECTQKKCAQRVDVGGLTDNSGSLMAGECSNLLHRICLRIGAR